jgi:hypothetical protein
MDEHTTEHLEIIAASEPTIYEQLYRQLYAYHFGAIGFLELLDRFEEILAITPSDDQSTGTA